mgnify:FL=1
MDVAGKKVIFLSASALLVILSLTSIAVFGFRQGIDLAGGTNWQIKFEEENATLSGIQGYFESAGIKGFSAREISKKNFILRLPAISEEEHREYLERLREKFGKFNEERFESIGPAVGAELRKKSLTALVLVLGGISLYVTWAFRKVSKPVQSWKYGVITLLTLFHDTIVPAGLLSFLGYYKNVEIDTNFIVALLVIMGFSVHDTIVVFDRIRENLTANRGQVSLAGTINKSVRETLARSVNTSLTLVLMLTALYIFGPLSLKYFILVILTGTVVGTYSSIFVASPLIIVLKRKK